ncbi:MAG: hypothetical protein ACLFTK_12350 [Anaerolineales bacterium]
MSLSYEDKLILYTHALLAAVQAVPEQLEYTYEADPEAVKLPWHEQSYFSRDDLLGIVTDWLARAPEAERESLQADLYGLGEKLIDGAVKALAQGVTMAKQDRYHSDEALWHAYYAWWREVLGAYNHLAREFDDPHSPAGQRYRETLNALAYSARILALHQTLPTFHALPDPIKTRLPHLARSLAYEWSQAITNHSRR